MIPFFRKIRYKLAKENQFLKYSRYAIGEIVLVVVGILIALYINNWNERRKEKEKFDQVLIEVEKELIHNIERARQTLDNYHRVDSLSNIFFFDSLTIEDYRMEPNLPLQSFGYSIFGWPMKMDAYRKLMSYSEGIDHEQDSVINSLSLVYGPTRKGIEIFFEESKQAANKTDIDQINYPWYSDLYKNVYSDEALMYVSNEPVHRNNISRYINKSIGEYVRLIEEFDITGRVCYSKIHIYLAEKYSNHSEPVRFRYEARDYNHLVGAYKPIWYSDNTMAAIDSMVISIDNDTLFYSTFLENSINARTEIIPVNNSYFRTELGAGYYQIVYDDSGLVERVDFSGSQRWLKQKKVR